MDLDMIPMTIESLALGLIPQPSVLSLRPSKALALPGEEDDDIYDRVLPIWIGPTEAAAIAAAIDRTRAERPLTHPTMAQIIRSMGGSVSRAVIDRVKGTTFYATVYLRCPNGMYTRVDARPSDAIALVIRADAPLFVSREVLEAAALPRSFKPGADRKIEMEEFHKFIEDVKPEDFVTEGN